MRVLPILLLCAPLLCRAQQPVASSAPVPMQSKAVQPEGTGGIDGEVTDTSGALVPGAKVTLTMDAPGSAEHTALTDEDGDFTFRGVAAGSFHLKIVADGLQSGAVKGSLLAGQYLELPPIALTVAATNTQVEVTFTREELGVAEVQAEEKQRVLGFLPNFGVAYDWNAPPMTSEQKYHVAAKAVFDPVSLAIVAGSAGVEQAFNVFPGYGPGWGGYGKRAASNLGDSLFGTFLTGAVLPQVFHQDPRYFWKGSGSVHSRVVYALESVVMCRADKDGHWEPNYSNVFGSLGAGALSNAYYPASSRQGVSLTFENTLLGLASGGISNIVQEFLLHHLTPKLPKATPAPLTPQP